MRTLGIDPALSGAIVLLDEMGIVSDVWSWKPCQRQKRSAFNLTYTVTDCDEATTYITRTIGGIAEYISRHINDPIQIGCEQAFANVSNLDYIPNPMFRKAKQTANLRAGLSVAETGGGLVESFNALLGDKVTSVGWVMATGWRAKVINLKSRARTEECKRQSLLQIPLRLPSIVHHLRLHGQLDHITDACGVALWHRNIGSKL
jgi:hypothetical protein